MANAFSSFLSPINLTLKCPGDKCKCEITNSQIESLLPNELVSKYQRLELLSMTREFTGKKLMFNDINQFYFILCPDCNYGYDMPITSKHNFQCELCKVFRCSLCMSRDHMTSACISNSDVTKKPTSI